MIMLPPSLLIFLTLALPPALSYASPQPPFVSEEFWHLMPRNTLFFPLSSLSSRQAPTNLQTFKEALGGFTAPPVTDSGNEKQPFLIDGEAVGDFATAVGKSCDKQKNDCADAANGDQRGVFEVGDCDEQNNKCKAAIDSATVRDFSGGGGGGGGNNGGNGGNGGGNTGALVLTGPDPENPEFDLFCQP